MGQLKYNKRIPSPFSQWVVDGDVKPLHFVQKTGRQIEKSNARLEMLSIDPFHEFDQLSFSTSN